MTLEIQLLRTSASGILIPVERLTYPLNEIELAKAKAKSLLESASRNPSVTAARIIDQTGNELFSCRVENDLGWG